MNNDMAAGARPYSARELVLMFLGAVALCGVFFSLGFLVGFKEKNILPGWDILKPSESASSSAESPTAAGDQKAGSKSAASETRTVPLSFNGSEQEKKASARLEKPFTAKAASRVASSRTPSSRAVLNKRFQAGRNRFPTGTPYRWPRCLRRKMRNRSIGALKGKNYRVFIVQPQYSEANDNLFRVQVGPFLTREEAEESRDKLSQEGFKSLHSQVVNLPSGPEIDSFPDRVAGDGPRRSIPEVSPPVCGSPIAPSPELD